MTTNVVALFDDFGHAKMALQEIRDLGIPNADIGFAAHDVSGSYRRELEGGGTGAEGAATGAATGAVLGGVTGLLVGLGALVIPGIGPIIAAGPLAAAFGALAGAGLGAAAGGVLGALVDLGLPKEEAEYYVEGIRRGGTLITVKSPENKATQVRQIMDRHHAVNIQERVSSWREQGWTGFQPNAKPYTESQIMDERRRFSPMSYTDYEPAFRGHYQTNYARSGYQYEHFRPAYEYGWRLRQDERYRGRSWAEVERDAQRDWVARNPGTTWDDIKGAVRHAWESLKDEARDIRAGRE